MPWLRMRAIRKEELHIRSLEPGALGLQEVCGALCQSFFAEYDVQIAG